jgi:hypothetical protein
VDELERNWLEDKILAVLSDDLVVEGDIITCQRSVSAALKEAVRGIPMVILPNHSNLETVLTIIVVVAVLDEDFELCVRDFKLHIEIQALYPVIVVELAG